MQEFPAIRYRAIGAGEANPATSGRDCAPLKLATALWERLLQYKALPNYPQSESCDLIILTRAADPVRAASPGHGLLCTQPEHNTLMSLKKTSVGSPH